MMVIYNNEAVIEEEALRIFFRKILIFVEIGGYDIKSVFLLSAGLYIMIYSKIGQVRESVAHSLRGVH